MTDRETIITNGDSGGGATLAVVLGLVVAAILIAYFVFGFRPAGAPAAVTVDVPAVTVQTPAPANP